MTVALFAILALTAVAGCGSSRGHAVASSSALRPRHPPDRGTVHRRPAAFTAVATAWLIDHGRRDRRWVALTFDADMTRAMLAALRSGRQRSWYDARIVSELKATHTPATIFLTGLWTLTYRRVVRMLARDPLFELENHSVDHSGWTAPCFGLRIVRGELSKRAEIGNAASTIRAVAGVRARYFRFPGGCHSRADLRLVASAGEQPVGWDVVSGDPFLVSPAQIVANVLRSVRPGSIVVMHLVGAPNAPATAQALPLIIAGLRARGYRLVTLRTLLSPERPPWSVRRR